MPKLSQIREVFRSNNYLVIKTDTMLRIKQVKSIIDRPEDQKRTIKALGLGKINKVVDKQDTPQIRGMVAKVKHLVEVQVI
ncbi:50S ribosomal protein L30 [Ignavibacteria bacterium CHB1]|jgi:LSU ribosomal protein L30P|nr:MAG: 50S ribosomal protein L30 [Chlorobiota bacterium]KXK06162.1 MAG: 50S ribosomal protein L30 [Chlorobi bacterium OLB4]MBV6398590.1 hypothetical protein [Ignavibacteria bacterium]MCC6885825.1 50S ribosomal protein L30 [Ignavibacteriales bacterium]MCE7952980.1 50S ribosomal protein L30 [Chlorobi bacterium CHB7]MDL1887182.1 50S ribosomal protein L30 [Ignavibacteria bacterium CHB1]OQY78075.1 MAG: 50S ribosomal protein L30 [Ignavibacteriales bacterium UTCHB1]RIK49802.1 MAG: 50S ribosomal pr